MKLTINGISRKNLPDKQLMLFTESKGIIVQYQGDRINLEMPVILEISDDGILLKLENKNLMQAVTSILISKVDLQISK